MVIERWEPMRDFITLRQAMDRLFEDATIGPGSRYDRSERVMKLPVDAYSTENELVLVAPVPGADPDKVEITIEGDTVTIKGEMIPPLDNVNYIFRERAYGPFMRSLTLNVPVQADKAEATFKNGLLTLIIPKAEAVKPKSIKVKSVK